MKRFLKFISVVIVVGIFVNPAHAQPATQAQDKQIIRSDFFAEEYPTYPVCKIENLSMIDDVIGPFLDGQCLKRNSSNQWVGGSCGTSSQQGGSGFDFTSSLADLQHSWIFPLQQRPLTASVTFTSGSCPSGWGTACWSNEPNAVSGTVVGVNGGTVPSDIVLVSNNRVAYASASNKRASKVWIGSTSYNVDPIAHTGTLGSRQVVYSTLKTPLPGINWQNVRFEFSDGTFSPATTGTGVQRVADKRLLIDYLGIRNFTPTSDNIYPATEAIIKPGSNVSITKDDANNTLTISASSGGGSGPSDTAEQIKEKLENLTGNDRLDATAVKNIPSGEVIALDDTPTDLTSYVRNQILPINTIASGKWVEVKGSNVLHGFKMEGTTDPNNANNKGFSLVGDKYGKVFTEEGGAELNASNSPIGRFEVASGTDNLTILIKKEDLSPTDLARTSIYLRVYQSKPGTENDELTTLTLNKGTETTQESIVYVTYVNSVQGDASAIDDSFDNIYGFRLFTQKSSNR